MNRKLMTGLLLAALMLLTACATGEEPTVTSAPPSATPTEEVIVTEEVATEEAVETEESGVEVIATEDATEEVAMLLTDVSETEEADMMATDEATATEAMTMETEEADATDEIMMTEEATATEAMIMETEEADATDEMMMTEEATATEAMTMMTEEADATDEMMMTDEATATEAMTMMTEEADATDEMDMDATEEADMMATDEMDMDVTDEPDMMATDEADVAGTVDLSGTIESVCLVTDLGRVNDGGFNQSAYNGVLRAEGELGLDTIFIETQNQADYATNIDTCITDGYNAVVTVGFLIADATYQAALDNPDVYFIGVDQFITDPLPNLVGLQFREDQGGFLAGAMAGLMTESNIIAGVYGEEIPAVVKFRNGFEQGARYVNPDVEILGVYVGSFIAQAEGAEAANQFIGEGADVIFGAGGPTGSGGILEAAAQGVMVIGVDQDEFLTTFGNGETPGAEFIITSAIKRVDEGVYQMLNALSEGDYGFPTNSFVLLDAASDGIGFAPANLADVPEEVTEQVQEILDMLKSGELDTGVDPVTGELLDAEADMDMDATEEAEMMATEEMDMDATEEAEETPEATPTA